MNNQKVMYNLPKSYLSFSAIDQFLKAPEQFRLRYYEEREMVVTPELAFGKKIAELLENKDDSLNHIKQLAKPEQKFNITIEGVPLFGFIDSFDPERNRFLEFKTGRQPWTRSRVDKHLQLPIYSLAIEEKFGSVEDECELIWLETRKVDRPQVGLMTAQDCYDIELTGEVRSFPRVITQAERDDTRALIVQVAKDISEDYTRWQEAKDRPRLGLR